MMKTLMAIMQEMLHIMRKHRGGFMATGGSGPEPEVVHTHPPPPPPTPHPPPPRGHQSCERGSGSRKSHRHNTVLLLDMAVNDIHISGTMSMWNLNIFMIWWRICKINNRGADSANVCPEFCQVRLFQIVCVLLNVVHEHCCFV